MFFLFSDKVQVSITYTTISLSDVSKSTQMEIIRPRAPGSSRVWPTLEGSGARGAPNDHKGCEADCAERLNKYVPIVLSGS